MNEFLPGDVVECVNAEFRPPNRTVWPIPGGYYTVQRELSGGTLTVRELPGQPLGSTRFRLIKRPPPLPPQLEPMASDLIAEYRKEINQ